MKKVVIILGFFIFMSGAALVYGEDISRDKWLSNIKKDLRKSMCVKTSFFRRCFEVSKDQCSETAGRAINGCINELKGHIPVKIRKDNTDDWGVRLGRCAGAAYEKELSKRAIQSEECNTVPYWIEQ